MAKRTLFTLIGFALIVIGYANFGIGLRFVFFVFGLLIPIGLLLEVIWILKRKAN